MKDVEAGPLVALLVFEAAGCLMALPASEVARLGKGEKRDREGFSSDAHEKPSRSLFSLDLDELFTGTPTDGPWLEWSRGARHASLRVKCVVEVVLCAISALTPMPSILRGQAHTSAFRAAGVQGEEVFLLLDPVRLMP